MKKIVTKNHRDWHEHLPYALWAYRTSIRMPIGATPFSLVYGAEAVMPTDLEHDSPRVVNYVEADNKSSRKLSVDLLEEARELALARTAIYQ